jgi:hypothetical protein
MGTASNVTTGKPSKVSGWVHVAPKGVALPTSTTESLDSSFFDLGYISDSGVVNSNSPSYDTVNAWGGDPVLRMLTEKDDTFQFALLEALNVNVLKTVYGEENVTISEGGAISIKANSEEMDPMTYVFDMLLRGNVKKRIVLPSAVLTELGDITYADSDAVAYEVTLGCEPDESGNTHYEYIGEDKTTNAEETAATTEEKTVDLGK